MNTQNTDQEIRTLLETSKTIAVIGLSPVPARPSYGVAKFLMGKGYKITGVRPASPPEILGAPCVESLAAITGPIDIIDVFRNSDAIPGLIDEIEQWLKTQTTRPKALWLQEGISHPTAEARARALGLIVISDRCILKEHIRLIK